MSGLLGLLDLGANSFQSTNAGVAIAGKNIANINTPGYSRERTDSTSGNVGTRQEAPLLSSRERLAAGASGMADAQASALSGLETDLTNGTDINQAIGSFFGAAAKLAASPPEESLRQALIEMAKELAAALKQSGDKVSQSQQEANQRINSYAAEATRLAKQVASSNQAIAAGSTDPTLADQRDQAAKQLAELVGGQARVDADGNMRVTAGGGTVLVDGIKSMTVTTSGDPTDPTSMKVQVVDGTHVDDVTNRLDGGKIAGELAFRDGTAEQAATNLDNLAYDLATQVNAVHSAAVGLDGSTGNNLFAQPTQRSGAAKGMAINAAVDANHALLATAGIGEGQSGSGGLVALTGLADAKIAGGNQRTFLDEGIRLIGSVGSASASAKTAKAAASAQTESLAGLRDSASGVSQEDELTKLSAFQNVAAASLKFVATVNDMLTNLIQTL